MGPSFDRLIDYFDALPCGRRVTASDIARETGMSSDTARSLCRALANKKLIGRRPGRPQWFYRLTQEDRQ